MAIRTGNIKSVKFLEEPLGSDKGGVALITFDLINQVCTGGADTISLGSAGGQDAGVTNTATLATIMQNRRRDGRTVTITGVAAASVFPGAQGTTTMYAQAAVTAAGNVTGITLNTAASGGSSATTTAAAWDRACGICVTYTAV